MNIYGIYNIKEKEQCLRVGTIDEIVKFLNFTPREIGNALKKGTLARGQYQVCFLFKE